jgi:membrane protein implicated in regulation of membrane protease activity
MTIARRILGALLFLTGVVWLGQGLNLISGSSMTGSTFWAVVGALCVTGGLLLLGWPWRQPRERSEQSQP